MEIIRGKISQHLDWTGLRARIKNYGQVILDLGTGDGRYVRALAEQHPDWCVIGLDACRENLRASSRLDLANTLFIIANVQALPQELYGLVSQVTINFPWGSLLESLLAGDAALMSRLAKIAEPRAQIDIRLNGGALAEAGSNLEKGTQVIYEHMNRYGWNLKAPCLMETHRLRTFPTTWAKRLAYGRDPRAVEVHGSFAK
jgi:16S rRNA (adenine(1408)-N(1))-methyltransferase